MTLTARDDRIQDGYRRYLHTHHLAPADDLEDCYSTAWLDGGKQVLHDTAQLAELVPTMRALMTMADDLIGRLEKLIAWFEAEP